MIVYLFLIIVISVVISTRGRTILDSSVILPRLGLGTAGLGGLTESVVSSALNYGVRLIDTAQAREWYDEESVGKALRQHDSVISPLIVTKIHPRSYSLQSMDRSLEGSSKHFEQFGMAAVLLHAPFCWRGQCTKQQESVHWSTAWKNLETLQDKFHIQMIGVSNFDIDQLEEIVLHVADRQVSVIQNWMDPFHQDRAVRSFAKQNGIQYMAYSSFGTQWQGKGFNPVFESDVLRNIADKYSCSIAKVVLAWLLEEGVTVIPRSTKDDHLFDNFGVCEGGKSALCNDVFVEDIDTFLTSEDMEQIRALDGSIGLPWD
jgi:diketogulonate reductase-like aldo/keto reductase